MIQFLKTRLMSGYIHRFSYSITMKYFCHNDDIGYKSIIMTFYILFFDSAAGNDSCNLLSD